MAQAAQQGSKPAWVKRYGKLLEVTDRQGKNGPYVSFKLQCTGFDQYGACWDEKLIKDMKAAIGERVWMRGPVDSHMRPGPNGTSIPSKSFKVIDFRISKFDDDQSQEAEAAA